MRHEILTPEYFFGKRVVVMGLGLHGGGLGTTIWMMRHGAYVTVTDLRDQHVLAPSLAEIEKEFIRSQREFGKGKVQRIRYVLGRHEESDFIEADLIMQNPGVPNSSPFLELARKNGARIENEASVFFQLCPFPIIGVTGTRGKTTTAMLIGKITKLHDRRSVIAGNLRISMLGLLDGLIEKKDTKKPLHVVLELSSWHLEHLAQYELSPHVGVITNIYPDHLNRYRDMDEYVAAKANNVIYQHEGDFAILNAENEWTKAVGEKVRESTIVWFAKSLPGEVERGVFVSGNEIVVRDRGNEYKVLAVKDVVIPGEHNLMNVLSAVGATYFSGVPLDIISKAIASFEGVPNRQELIATIGGVRWINDTAATSPDASIVALRTFGIDSSEKRIVLISGGADKKLEFDEWAGEVVKYVKAVVLFDGTATPRMEEALKHAECSVPLIGARNMDEAVRIASEHAEDGDVVLLSPGCASFGLFLHEFDRGEQFVRAVKLLGRNKT